MKKIQELQKIKEDAYDYYVDDDQDQLFEKIFLVDEIVEEIKRPDKYFLVGEKGSGKTAYSVYLSKKSQEDCFCVIQQVEDTLYQRFLNMKNQKAMALSGYKEIWINLIYLVLAENIREKYGDDLFFNLKYKQLMQAIQTFYSDAFKPEFVNAFEFVNNATNSINVMTKKGVFSSGLESARGKTQKYEEQSYQISMMKIRDGFERAFRKMELGRQMILFIDGIDARPKEIDNEQYFSCILGLVNAVLELNQSELRKQNIKIMLLIRPDIIYQMPVHNLNQKLRNHSVLLNWVTTYKDYVNSKLYRVADDYFNKQQDKVCQFSECWNYYFPYLVRDKRGEYADNPFIEFLRYSLYKPRDILTMLNEMVDATQGDHFSHEDFLDMLNRYALYLKGELKDYMLVYMNETEYNNFYLFFDFFQGLRRFVYKEFEEKHLEYVQYLRKLERAIPPHMNTAAEALQLLYDNNIVGCYVDEADKGHGARMYWSYKERNYANVQPEVRKNASYSFHLAYAYAFRIL